jgi:uncharacterized protein (TIGR02246 family)
MTTESASEDVLRGVLDQWQSAVDAHEPERVASCFTEDAIFQGLHPYSVGRAGVAEYYDGQPAGMTAAYEILETRRIARDAVLGYLAVEFGFTDGRVLAVRLTVIVAQAEGRWLIRHYHVSRAG